MLQLFSGPTKAVSSSKVIWLIKYAHYLMHVEIWTFHTSGKSCYMNKYNTTVNDLPKYLNITYLCTYLPMFVLEN